MENVPGRKHRAKTWVMAIDPFAGFDLGPTLNFARHAAEQAHAEVHVVYVLGPAALNWTGDFSGPWMQRYLPIAKNKLEEVMAGFDWKRVVIPCRSASQKTCVGALERYAARVNADCILISTHARRGLERMVMGSFAETLILSSKIPVMISNPERSVPSQVRKILVPTDLDEDVSTFVSSVAEYAQEMGAEIVLYYKQSDPLDPIVQQGVYSLGGGWVSMQSYIEQELERKEKVIDRIETMLRKRQVKVSHVLDSSPGDLVESIDRAARESGADLVSLRTHASPWESAVLGSVARGLVRHASVPVLVQR